MRAPLSKIVAIAVTAILAVAALDPALARHKKARPKPQAAPDIVRDYDGTPIIMEGLKRPKRPAWEMDEAKERAEHPYPRPRGSSTYIPPPVPSPSAGPPPPALLQPAPALPQPPPITTFSDRVTRCIHSFPLNAGIGNNPTNLDAYVRQCAN
jgi:hypothetical protein